VTPEERAAVDASLALGAVRCSGCGAEIEGVRLRLAGPRHAGQDGPAGSITGYPQLRWLWNPNTDRWLVYCDAVCRSADSVAGPEMFAFPPREEKG
jgi:hypothetical protein